MFRQMLRNGQVTLPKEAVESFNLKAGDPLEIEFDGKGIHIRPLGVQEFSEEEYALLAKKLDTLRHEKGIVFDTIQEARKYLKKLVKEP